jgi:hypothetical protein
LSIVVSLVIVAPVDAGAQAAASVGQHAGKIANLIPAVNIIRAGQQAPAESQAPVMWEDTLATGHLARARVLLDEGSVLNVGSDSSLRVTKHDASAQQTELELQYGRVRSNAVKQTKPGASFQIRTPTGVAGVVGTDFFLDFENYVTRLIVYEGRVRFCNLAGICVEVGQGQMSTIRADQAPDAPVPAPLDMVVDASKETMISPQGNLGVAAHGGAFAGHGLLVGTLIAVGVAVPTGLVVGLSRTPGCGCTTIKTPGSTGTNAK